MKIRTLLIASVLVIPAVAALLLFPGARLSETETQKAAPTLSQTAAFSPGDDQSGQAFLPASPASPMEPTHLGEYLCISCEGIDPGEDPFVAESEEEARWMFRRGFPTRKQRSWVDLASIEEVERKALDEGDNPSWALELIRKRCSISNNEIRFCKDELSRARQLLQTRNLDYASYVISEGSVRIGNDRSLFESEPAEARRLLTEAIREMTLAGLRGDGKARFELSRIASDAPPWYSQRDFARAVSSALNAHEVTARARSLRGLPPVLPEFRPSRSAEDVARQMAILPGQ
jgi:hypothetical protein